MHSLLQSISEALKRCYSGAYCGWRMCSCRARAICQDVSSNYTCRLTSSDTCSGTRVSVKFPSGQRLSINYHCSQVSNTSIPKIWFEATDAHGVVDFLGLQYFLQEEHAIPSCAYDPPNFGWSSSLPASIQNTTDTLPALLRSLNQQDQSRILAGWGGGLETAVRHATQDPEHTSAVINLDASADGIEWLDMKRIMNWDEVQMLDYRKLTLNGRVSLARTLLTLGIGW
jgi:hypothetical protein